MSYQYKSGYKNYAFSVEHFAFIFAFAWGYGDTELSNQNQAERCVAIDRG